MKLTTVSVRNSLLLLGGIFVFSGLRAAAQTKPAAARITQAIDEKNLVQLRGNVHPLARAEFDQGVVADSQPMNRMLLLLQRSPEQEAALQQLMSEQQSKDSPNFHKWLTPEQFGQQFGPADADIQAVTQWLTGQGFQNIKVGPGRTVIEFSGNVGQVRNALHTEIHRFVVDGEQRQANVSDPQIPAALSPVVAGIRSLHNLHPRPMRHVVGEFSRSSSTGEVKSANPQFTTSGGNFAVGPADFATIYNIPATMTGAGVTVAIVGDSNINPQDVTDFRNLFGLPANPPTIILNGPDPGISSGMAGDEGEADLDVQWSGAVAPLAKIDLVVSEDTQTSAGVDLSALYIIDNNLAAAMSESFGSCETNLGTAGNAFFNALWEQAAAQGITVAVSAGDPGSAGCDNFNSSKAATHGLAVSGIASTPFNVAVGGTDFDDVGTQPSFWNAANIPGTRESAKGYIPETTWNDSCAATATTGSLTSCVSPAASLQNIVGGSGGPSAVYAKPPWQTGPGVPADAHRDIPDVSLFASDGLQSKSFYVVCQADAIPTGGNPSCAGTGSFSFLAVGGTSASAPTFAGIMALINQATGQRQGNANFVLYKIAQTATNSCNSSSRTDPTVPPPAGCAFNDVTKGDNSVPCAGNSPNCSSTTAGTNGVLVDPAHPTTPAWTTGTGYDLATGLGSVNVGNLAAAWPTAVGSFKPTSANLTLNGGTSPITITHGASVTAAITVASNPPAGTPSGDVSLQAGAPGTTNSGVDEHTLAAGTTMFTTTFLPGGSYNVTAHYPGDGTFAASDSNAVPVVVSKENSRLQIGIVTLSAATGNITSTNATTFAYGSPYVLRIDILNSTANACQPLVTGGVTSGCAIDATGSVTITDNGTALDAGTFGINSLGHAEDQPIQLPPGQHVLSANYSGDSSYNGSGPVTDTLTVTKATTATTVASSATTIVSGTSVTLTATIGTQSNGAGPTGTVTFSVNGAAVTNGTVTVRDFDDHVNGHGNSAVHGPPEAKCAGGTGLHARWRDFACVWIFCAENACRKAARVCVRVCSGGYAWLARRWDYRMRGREQYSASKDPDHLRELWR